MESSAEKRKYGEGSIYTMKDGRKAASVSLGFDKTGKRIRHTETAKTEKEAKLKMENWLLRNGYLKQEYEDISITSSVEDFVKAFEMRELMNSGIASRTFENYRNTLKPFFSYFSNESIGEIQTEQINQFLSFLSNRTDAKGKYIYKQITLNKIRYIVNRLFDWGVKKGYIQINPMKNADFKNMKSKIRTKSVSSFKKEDITTILNVCKADPVIYHVINFMFATGVRTQEALGLRWMDIDFKMCEVNIRKAITLDYKYDIDGNKIKTQTVLGPTKNGSSERVIKVPQTTIDILLDWKKQAPKISKTKTGKADYVFGNRKNPCWTYAGFRCSVNRLIKNSQRNTDSIQLHRIRHTVATLLSNQPDANVFHIMQLLGHTQLKTAQKYIDCQTEERKEKNCEFLERIIVGL